MNTFAEPVRATISRAMLSDPALSLEARGFLAAVLSQPEGWVFSTEWALAELRCGRAKLNRLIRELTQRGYADVERARAGGRFGANTWRFTDEPTRSSSLAA